MAKSPLAAITVFCLCQTVCTSGSSYLCSFFWAKVIPLWSHHTGEPFPPSLPWLQMGFHSFFFPPLMTFFPNSSINPVLWSIWSLTSELWITRVTLGLLFTSLTNPLFKCSLTLRGKVQGEMKTYKALYGSSKKQLQL